MAWVAVDYIGEWIFNYKPDMWAGDCIEHNYWLPQDRHGAYRFGYYHGKKDSGKIAGDHRLIKAIKLTKSSV